MVISPQTSHKYVSSKARSHTNLVSKQFLFFSGAMVGIATLISLFVCLHLAIIISCSQSFIKFNKVICLMYYIIEVNEITGETSVLEPRHLKHRRAQEHKFSELRSRKMLKDKAMHRKLQHLEPTGEAAEIPMTGRKSQHIVQRLDSSSEEDVRREKKDHLCRSDNSTNISQSGMGFIQQASHPVSSHDDVSPPLLSLKSRIGKKLGQSDRYDLTARESPSSLKTTLRITSLHQNSLKSNQIRTGCTSSGVTTPTEMPLFSLDLGDLDINLDDDDDPGDHDVVSVHHDSHHSAQISVANQQTTKGSAVVSVHSNNSTVPLKPSAMSSKQQVTSTVVSPPGVQSREERLRLSRLKKEEFRKKFTYQNENGKESNQSMNWFL